MLVSILFNSTEAGSSQFALWVAFFEIYNECVYDLLQPSLSSKSKKRTSLRVCDDGAGNAYIKGVNLPYHVLKAEESVFLSLKIKHSVCFGFLYFRS